MFIPELARSLKGYSRADFKADLAAGLVVGLVALPLAMAFAIASGLPPERGLYTAVIAGFLISALGGSRVQIGGPTGAFVVIVAGIVAKFGYEGLAVATCMAGILLLAMGVFKLGTLVKFIPYPVTTGFTSGIAVIIFSSQVRDFLGLNLASVPADFFEKWQAYGSQFGSVNFYALGLGLFTMACMRFWPKSWAVPGSLVALVVASAVVWYFQLPVETIQSRFGGVPQSLPAPHFPAFSWFQLKQLISPAVTIALLAAIESLLSAVVADGMTGFHHDSNTELIGQGFANLLAPLFGGFCATGAIARTATNIKNGGRTPVAGIVHAGVLLLILLTAAPLAARIPLASLAGVLVVVSYHMSEWRSFRTLLSGPRADVAVLLVTFLLTVLVDLTVAVEVGMILAAFLFMKQMADLAQVKALTRESQGKTSFESDLSHKGMAVPMDVEIFELHGSFFFGAASQLMETLRFLEKKPRAIVLEMRGVLHLDATGLHALDALHADCARRGIRLVLSGIHSQPLFLLQDSPLMVKFGEGNLKGDLKETLEAL